MSPRESIDKATIDFESAIVIESSRGLGVLKGSLDPLVESVDTRALPDSEWLSGAASPGDGAGDALWNERDERLRGAQPTGLTVRETEALHLLAQGRTAASAARAMGCSTSMVNRHLGRVYRKLGVSDRLGAVLEAQRRGLLPRHDARSSSFPAASGPAPRPASIGGAAS